MEGRMDRVKELDTLCRRMRKGVREEFLDICSIKGVGRVTGRELFERGIKTAKEYYAHQEGADRLDRYLG